MKKSTAKLILDLLKKTDTIHPNITGKVIIVLNVTQGGLQDSSLTVNQKAT
jgi:hypothetical protein